jgi:hypothetical protein
MHVPTGDVGRARLTLEELSKRLEIELTQGTIAELAEDDPLRPLGWRLTGWRAKPQKPWPAWNFN